MPSSGFQQFREFVLGAPALQALLRDELDADAFISRTVELGREQGFSFTADEVQDVLRSSRRGWIERWIEPR